MADRIRVSVFPGVQHLALFAGQAKGFFAKHGLEVEIQFTLSSQAQRDGFRNLGLAVQFIGPYQDTGAFVMRKWATANTAMLESYIQAYVESLRWALKPTNKMEATAILAELLKLDREVAARAYEFALNPLCGFALDARFDAKGFEEVLALRAEIEGQWGGTAPAAERYYDLSYYERALTALEGGKDG